MIRKPSSANNAKKERKTTERLEISKKIRDTKGTFHAKMGSIKDRNGRIGGMNTQENCTKKSFTTQIITMV